MRRPGCRCSRSGRARRRARPAPGRGLCAAVTEPGARCAPRAVAGAAADATAGLAHADPAGSGAPWAAAAYEAHAPRRGAGPQGAPRRRAGRPAGGLLARCVAAVGPGRCCWCRCRAGPVPSGRAVTTRCSTSYAAPRGSCRRRRVAPLLRLARRGARPGRSHRGRAGRQPGRFAVVPDRRAAPVRGPPRRGSSCATTCSPPVPPRARRSARWPPRVWTCGRSRSSRPRCGGGPAVDRTRPANCPAHAFRRDRAVD